MRRVLSVLVLLGTLSSLAVAQHNESYTDPDLEMPDYFTMTDFHQHPGGVAGDPLAGASIRHAA